MKLRIKSFQFVTESKQAIPNSVFQKKTNCTLKKDNIILSIYKFFKYTV